MVALATSRLTDNDTTLPWLGTTTIGEPVIIKALPVPLEDTWPSLGARPKKLHCSTQFAPEPWITARGNKHRRRRSCGASTTTSQGQQPLPLAPVEVLHLSNKFHALEQLPTSQPTQSAPPAGIPDASAAYPEAAVVGLGTAPAPVSTVSVSVAPAGSSPSPYTTRSCIPPGSSQPDNPPPSTIVLGSSIVRHIRVRGGTHLLLSWSLCVRHPGTATHSTTTTPGVHQAHCARLV